MEPAVVEYTLRGIRNVLVGLKMIDGDVVEPAFRFVAEQTKWMRAEKGGFLKFHVHPGDTVEEGQPLATNTSLSGRNPNTIIAPRDAIVLGMTTLPCGITRGSGRSPSISEPERVPEDGTGDR